MKKQGLDGFVEKAIEELNDREEEYKKARDVIKKELLEICSSEFEGIEVIGRIKRVDHLREKVIRKNYHIKYENAASFIDDLPDGIGIRIICAFNDDEQKIVQLLQNRVDDLQKNNIEIDTSNQPQLQKNGLPIYRMDGRINSDGRTIRFELQVKSQVHNLWGEMEHTLFYKNYDYIISSDIFSSFMLNIYDELAILDGEFMTLKRHLIKDIGDRALELRDIAARIISEKYESQIGTITNCSIDLREVYAVLADLFIGQSSDYRIILDRIQDLTKAINDSQALDNSEYNELEKKRVSVTHLSPRTKNLAQLIDENIKKGDVFWKILFLLFDRICKDESEYSRVLDKMAYKFIQMYEDVLDSIISDPEDMETYVDDVVYWTAKDINKISFFSLRYYLPEVKKCLNNKLCIIEAKCFDESLIEKNRDVITVYLYISLMISLKEPFSMNFLIKKYNGFLGMANDYDLRFTSDEIKIINTGFPEEFDSTAFKACFNIEEEQ